MVRITLASSEIPNVEAICGLVWIEEERSLWQTDVHMDIRESVMIILKSNG
jgi:hypothetical protein